MVTDRIYVRPRPVPVPVYYVVRPHMRRPKGGRKVDKS